MVLHFEWGRHKRVSFFYKDPPDNIYIPLTAAEDVQQMSAGDDGTEMLSEPFLLQGQERL